MNTRRTLTFAAFAAATMAVAGFGVADASTGNPTAAHRRSAVTGHSAPARVRARVAVTTAPGAAHAASVVYSWGEFGGRRLSRRHTHHGDQAPRPGNPKRGVGPVHALPHVVAGLPATVTQIATSNSDSYALTSTGAVYAWGAGAQGELGNGTRPWISSRAVRVALPAGVRITSLPNPMPYNGGMAIASNHRVWVWGNDLAQNFCLRQAAILTDPVELSLRDVTLAAGARSHSIYDAGGRIVSCGSGPFGQLGNGTRGPHARSSTPVAVDGLPSGHAVALTSGWGNAGVLMADGRYYDWGYNVDGQVGDGATEIATRAVPVALPDSVSRIFDGGSYFNNGQTMAILSDGQLWEWGAGQYGQLGDHATANALSPMRLASTRLHFIAVSSGGSTDYAIDRRGRLWSWGDNWADQLGNGSSVREQLTPAEDPLSAVQVSSTAHNVAALSIGRRVSASRSARSEPRRQPA